MSPEVGEELRIARSRAYELVADGEIQLERWLGDRRCVGVRW
ncbi:MAG: hypothetical protein ACFB50_15065 [Rubrobacteraceae bacterium]